ncbi:MAG TPA: hypothetical protein VE261_08580 [Gaiellaceae bacterium]|nr:hypothetical protein [Gaiellaceae bacterium]
MVKERVRALLERAFPRRRRRRFEDRSDWPDAPPDGGVREPRRPVVGGSSGAAVLDPPVDQD